MVDVVDVVGVGEKRIVSDYFTLGHTLHILSYICCILIRRLVYLRFPLTGNIPLDLGLFHTSSFLESLPYQLQPYFGSGPYMTARLH